MKISVTQRHDMSCGLACVSFITGKQYDLIALNEDEKRLDKAGFTCVGLVRRLAKEGLEYSWRKITDKKSMDNFAVGTIVFVGRSSALPHGHWLARSKHGWMDPWINLPINNDIAHARSGFRKLLPGKPEYVLIPQS